MGHGGVGSLTKKAVVLGTTSSLLSSFNPYLKSYLENIALHCLQFVLSPFETHPVTRMKIICQVREFEADRYLLKAVRTTPFFVSIAKVPFFLTLPLHIRCSLNHIALEVDVYKNSFSFSVNITFLQEM